MTPEAFREALSRHRSASSTKNSSHTTFEGDDYESGLSSLHVEVSYEDQDGSDSATQSPGPRTLDQDLGTGLAVPTIMLSNSLAAVPLSLESSQSLAPLAVRRGHHVPAPLQLGLCLNSCQEGLYPGIPSPFLGSPSSCETESDADRSPVTSTMDLDAMCRDLRMRCPPVRPVSPLPLPPSSPAGDASVASHPSGTPNGDSDDWDFAQDILIQYGDRVTDFRNGYLATPLKAKPAIGNEPQVHGQGQTPRIR